MALNILSKKSKSLVGIDIGSENIKVVELEHRKQKFFLLKNYALGMLENFTARTATTREVANVLKNILKRADINNRQAAMSLPAYSTFLALVDIPKMPDSELEDAINFEARKYIPVPLSEVTLGWSRSQGKILLIAVPKKLSQRYAEIAKLANLELRGLEAETFSLVRSLAKGEKGKVVIVDRGVHSTNISLVEDGEIRSNYTVSAQTPLNEEIPKIITKEKKDSIKIILSGGETGEDSIKSLEKVVGEKTKVVAGMPWQGIEYPKELDPTLGKLSNIFPVAIGLARRDYE